MRRGLALGEFGLPHYEELYRPRSAMAPRVAVRGVRRVRQVGGGGRRATTAGRLRGDAVRSYT